jgi:hypothetical protein
MASATSQQTQTQTLLVTLDAPSGLAASDFENYVEALVDLVSIAVLLTEDQKKIWRNRPFYRPLALKEIRATKLQIVTARYGSPLEIAFIFTVGSPGIIAIAVALSKIIGTLAASKRDLAEAKEREALARKADAETRGIEAATRRSKTLAGRSSPKMLREANKVLKREIDEEIGSRPYREEARVVGARLDLELGKHVHIYFNSERGDRSLSILTDHDVEYRIEN